MLIAHITGRCDKRTTEAQPNNWPPVQGWLAIDRRQPAVALVDAMIPRVGRLEFCGRVKAASLPTKETEGVHDAFRKADFD